MVKAQDVTLEVGLDRVGVISAGVERVIKAQDEALEVAQDRAGVL